MDRDHAPTYDEHWGEIAVPHKRFVRRALELSRPGGLLLDAACGTGKYWPMILASGRQVVGVDQAAGMVSQARAKHPAVPVAKIGLQELPYEAVFDGVLCVDALESVAPEDWGLVAERLARAARPAAPVYLTVELEPTEKVEAAYAAARAAGHPVVPGEVFDGRGYHFYPRREDIDQWLMEAGLELLDDAEGDGYLHLLLRRSETR